MEATAAAEYVATDPNRLLDPAELARYLQVPVNTVYRWRYHGEGPQGRKVGRHVRFRMRDVQAWLDAQ